MTIAEFENFCEATKHMTAVQRAESYGIDISPIDENLRLTPTEKIRQKISLSIKRKPFKSLSIKPVPNLESTACRLVEAEVEFSLSAMWI